MADIENTPVPSAPIESEPRRFNGIGPGSAKLLYGLFDRARDKLTEAELMSLTMRTEDAASLARQLAGLCEGLGCLVQSDVDLSGYSDTGSFQSADSVAQLLFIVGNTADQIDGLLQLACAAENELEFGRS